jgi:hypothetical protein
MNEDEEPGFDREVNSNLLKEGNPLLYPDSVAETIDERLAVIVTLQSENGEYSVVEGISDDQSVSSSVLRLVSEIRDDREKLKSVLSE